MTFRIRFFAILNLFQGLLHRTVLSLSTDFFKKKLI